MSNGYQSIRLYPYKYWTFGQALKCWNHLRSLKRPISFSNTSVLPIDKAVGKSKKGHVDQHEEIQRYVSYIRVSTDRQGQSGLGLEAQRRTISEFLKRQGFNGQHVAEFVEVESGKSVSNRPQLSAAIKRCRLLGATLVVAKLDRLSRELWFITFIREFGVKFICADNPKIDELTLQILGAVAQHERQLISDRTRAVLAAAKARGIKLGNPNFSSIRNQTTKAAHAKIQRNADKFASEVLGNTKNHKRWRSNAYTNCQSTE